MKRFLVLLFLAPVAACDDDPAAPGGAGRPPVPPVPPSAVTLDAHLWTLAHDSMQGRRAGSEYELRAADYLRDEFIEYGLDAGVPDYHQVFTIPFAVGGETGLLSRNVVAVLPGSGDLALEWVVVGAHFDHLGLNSQDQPYNGADDNASGTALMLELARYFSEYVGNGMSGTRARRSMMFHGYGSEEIGLVGSNRYCSRPTVPMGDITAMMNLDMVGRLRNNTVYLIGTSSSDGWQPVIDVANIQLFDFIYFDGVLNRSDQYCFYQNGTPIIFLHTGDHGEYHTIADDVGLIDETGMARIGNFAVQVLLNLIHRPQPLIFDGNTLPEG
jgi:hypothetical protein